MNLYPARPIFTRFLLLSWLALAALAHGQTPVITAPPLSKLVIAGQPADFSVTATGDAPLTYQWKLHGRAIPGATAATYSIPSASIGDRGWYQVVVASGVTSTTSVFHLSVVPAGSRAVAWGSNASGQSSIPANLGPVLAVGGGEAHSIALKADGTIVGWGSDFYGQTSVPAGLTDVVQLLSGFRSNYALKGNGTLAGWGSLGVGGAVVVPAGTDRIVAVAAGHSHALALKADGTVLAWGNNDNGQTTVPAGLSDVVAVACGAFHSLALRTDGTVVAWGQTTFGRTAVPADLSGVVEITAGYGHSAALKADGTLIVWGDDAAGARSTALGASSGVSISAQNRFTLVGRPDGTVAVIGAANEPISTLPFGLSNVSAVASGLDHVLALMVPPPLTITRQPMDVAANLETDATISAAAAGTIPLRFQWKRNGVDVAANEKFVGSQSPTLTIKAVALVDAGTYTVVVTDATGNITSGSATLSVTTASPPPNDNFAAAQLLSGPSGTVDANNAAASLEPGEPMIYRGTGASIWFAWTAPASGRVRFDTIGSSIATALASNGDSPLGGLSWIYSSSGSSGAAIELTVQSGAVVRVAVDSASASRGPIRLNWLLTPAPANDNFAQAQLLSGTTGSLAGTNAGATGENGESAHYDTSGATSSVWYRWTATATGNATFQISATTMYSELLAVYSGPSLGALTRLGASAGYGGATRARVDLAVVEGTTYLIAIAAQNNVGGTFTLEYELQTPAVIVTPPTSRTALPGAATTFTVEATGSRLLYQWFCDGRKIPGGTQASLVRSNLQPADAGEYHVVVSNAFSTATSGRAQLTGPNPPPTIVAPPGDVVTTAGQSATLTLNATGVGALTYQWRRSGAPIPGATAATWVLANASRSDAGYYDVVAYDGLSLTVSPVARIDVSPTSYPGFSCAALTEVQAATGLGRVRTLVPSSDGKLYAAGTFATIDGQLRQNLGRLNPNGTIDPSFRPATQFLGSGFVVPVADGKIVVVGSFDRGSGQSAKTVVRFNADGSIDPTYARSRTEFEVDGVINAVAALPDGKLVIGGKNLIFGSELGRSLIVLTAAGEPDNSVAPPTSYEVYAIAVQPNGQFLAAADYYSGNTRQNDGVRRLDSNGAVDGTFNAGTGAWSNGTPAAISSLAVLGDGRILAAGVFDNFNGQHRNRIVRLLSTGAVDPGFLPPDISVLRKFAPLADGGVVVSGDYSTPTTTAVKFFRLKPDGSYDPTGLFGPAFNPAEFVVLADGSMIVANEEWLATRLVRYSPTGARESAYAPAIQNLAPVSALAHAPGGKVLIAGGFDQFGDVKSAFVARRTPGGVADSSFAVSGVNVGSGPEACAVSQLGAVTLINGVGGWKTGASFVGGIFRLLPNGALDPEFSFSPGSASLVGLGAGAHAWMSRHRLAVATSSDTWQGTPAKGLVVLQDDGSPDQSFDIGSGPRTATTAGRILALAAQRDGRLLVGGDFTQFSGVAAARIVRLQINGAVDRDFGGNVELGPQNPVRTIAVLPDGRILAGGDFTTWGGEPRGQLVRLHASGSLDRSFAAAQLAGPVDGVILQEDGKVMVRGRLNANTAPPYTGYLVRLEANGAIDPTFKVSGLTFALRDLIMTDSGRLLGAARPDVNGLMEFVPSSPPSITAQPVAQSVAPGATATFSVAATSAMPMTYQWHLNGEPIVGATTNTLTVAAAQLPNVGTYQVAVSNTFGTLMSNGVVLTGTNPLPTITTHPLDIAVQVGQPLALTVAATGAGALNYQWRRDGRPLPGANGATLDLGQATLAQSGIFDVVINDGLSVTISRAATVVVAPAAYPQVVQGDPAYSAAFEVGGGYPGGIVRLSRGRLIVFGSFSRIYGTPASNIARLAADGSVDPTFIGSFINGSVYAAAEQPDGKLIVGGVFTEVDGRSRTGLARLNVDGTLDPSFWSAGNYYGVFALALQADGKAVVGGGFAAALARVHADGSADPTFAPAPNGAVYTLAVQADGKVVAGGAFTTIAAASRNRLARLNPDGSTDPTFTIDTGLNAEVYAVRPLTGGRLLVGGKFTTCNGTAANRIVRLSATGAVDSPWSTGSGFNYDVYTLDVQTDGRILVGGAFGGFNGNERRAVARLGADGQLDPSFAPPLFSQAAVAVSYLDDGSVLVGGGFSVVAGATNTRMTLLRLTDTGNLHPNGPYPPGLLSPSTVSRLVAQPGGKVLASGPFTYVNGTPRTGLVRLNADGTTDSTFNPGGSGADGPVNDLAVLPDGRIMIAGSFTQYNGASFSPLALLTSDGRIDSSYVPSVTLTVSPTRILAQPSGEILLIGDRITSVPLPKSVVGLRPDGSLSSIFSAGLAEGGLVAAGAIQADGKIILVGTFSEYRGVPCDRIVRLRTDGSIDASFSARIDGSGSAVLVQPDGKIVIAGDFVAVNDVHRHRLARLHSDGSIDASFVPSFTVNAVPSLVVSQPDGRLLVGGGFSSLESYPAARYLIRVGSNGSLDTSFCAPALTAAPADVLLVEDGSLLLAGGTMRLGAFWRLGLVKTVSRSGPEILSPPLGGTLPAGVPFSLSIVVAGGQNLAYQWLKNGSAISGATQPTYQVTSAQVTHTGAYSVRITHTGGSVDSAAASVTIYAAAPTLSSVSGTISGFGGAIKAGSRWPLTAPALATGSEPISYQWSRNGTAIPGATTRLFFPPVWLPSDGGAYQVAITNSVGSVTAPTFSQGVTTSVDWDWLSPSPQGNSLGTVAFLNGRFLAGGNRGTVVTSTDAAAWQVVRLGTSNTVLGFAYGNSTYVALSGFSGLWNSADAVSWTQRVTGLGSDGNHLAAVGFGAGRFVAVGGGGILFTSVDGGAWVAALSGTNDSLGACAYGNGTFIVLGAAGRTLISTDGLVWRAGPVLPRAVGKLAFGAGRFVATVDNHVYTSIDGAAWTSRALATSSKIVALQHTSAGFLAGLNSTDGKFWQSPDGLTWTEKPASMVRESGAAALTYGAGKYVVVGATPEALLTSTDGILWSGSYAALDFAAVATGQSTLVALGPNGRLTVGADGQIRQDSYSGTLMYPDVRDLAFGNGMFVAVGGTGGGRAWRSPWSDYWILTSLGTVADLYGVNFLVDRFYAWGASGTILTSPDGVAWTTRTSGTTQTLRKGAFGAGSYVAVGAGGTVLTSPDGSTWTPRSANGITSMITDVIYAAGQFVLVSEGANIRTSPDGVDWTVRTNPLGAGLKSVVYGGGRFWAFTTGNTNYLVSPDGATWTAAQHGNANTTGDAVVSADRIYLAGTDGSIVSLPLNVAPPVIVAPPMTQTVTLASTATLSVNATGTGPFAYQWFKNSSALLGENGATLVLRNVTRTDAGSYSVMITNAAGSVTSPAATLTVNERGLVAAQAQVATTGPARGVFSIEGGTPKQMLVRAVGPSLASFGITGYAADPSLRIVSTATETELAANNDWHSAANAAQLVDVTAQIGAYPLIANSQDAAVLATFAPGTYRVNVGFAGASGTVLLEIYEADATPRLVYLATQAQVGTTGLSQSIGLLAAAPGRSYLIRALGPSLGGTDAMTDPTVAVFSGATQLAANDNWGGEATLATLGESVGAMPIANGSKDAALKFEPPARGVYSVRVSGAGGSGRVVLLEIFEADDARATTIPLALVSLPENLAVVAGQTAQLGVVAVGRPQPTYQWMKGGVLLPATQNTFVLPDAQLADAGVYSVRVTSGSMSLEASATLAVEMPVHSADTDRNYRISLLELTRVIELYNTRNGTTRTGAYAVATTSSEDGFAGAPDRAPGLGETLARYHSSDTNRDGRISLLELTRVIELFNVRTGTTRTGQYHPQAGSEDGFAPGQ